LKDATRDDGRKLVAAFGDVKSATAKRKMVPLVAMVNLAISENKLPPFNPFAAFVRVYPISRRYSASGVP
jgi:hypothetical protein